MIYETDCSTCPKQTDCGDEGNRTCTICECDVCHEEVDRSDLYDVGGVDVCSDCLIGYLEETGVIKKV